jgi:hypothetical protein
VEDETGQIVDLTDKAAIEKVIMANNEEKYKQSFHTPLFQFSPLITIWLQRLDPGSSASNCRCLRN